MADVIGRTIDRGQVILVTGLLIATTLLVLVLLLNAVIYTENVATRGIEGDTDNADLYQKTVVEEFGGILEAENWVQRYDDPENSSFGNLTERIDEAHVRFSNQTEARWLERGKVARFSYTLEEGLIVWEDDPVDLNESFDDGDSLVANANSSHRFYLNLSDVHTFNDSFANISGSDTENHALRLSSSNWEVRIFETDDGVHVTDADNESICDEETFELPLEVNFTAETVGGASCDSELWGDGHPTGAGETWDVTINNPENATAYFELVVVGEDLSTASSGGWAGYVDDANMTITFRSAEIRYEANTTLEVDSP